MTFKEAGMLAKKAGVELKAETEYDRKENQRKKTLQDLYNRIAQSYHLILTTKPYAEEARAYMKKRGIAALFKQSKELLSHDSSDDVKY